MESLLAEMEESETRWPKCWNENAAEMVNLDVRGEEGIQGALQIGTHVGGEIALRDGDLIEGRGGEVAFEAVGELVALSPAKKPAHGKPPGLRTRAL